MVLYYFVIYQYIIEEYQNNFSYERSKYLVDEPLKTEMNIN